MPVKHEQQSSHPIHKSSRQAYKTKESTHHPRTRGLMVIFYMLLTGVVFRLFYWQVISRASLQAEAQGQYTRVVPVSGQRGKIYTNDDYLLVGNQTVYRFYAQPYAMDSKTNIQTLAAQVAPLLVEQPKPVLLPASSANAISSSEGAAPIASPAATTAPPQTVEEIKASLISKLSDSQSHYVVLKQKVSENTKLQIETLNIQGLGFESYQVREYPEASMAAQVVGFVGKDKAGNDQGYFGIEGALDRELRGHVEKKTFLKDALGFSLLFGNKPEETQFDGRDVHLTIRRDIQYTVERMLKEGIDKYGASAGEIIIMDPQTGKVLAMADYPNYDPSHFYDFPAQLYKNPALVETFEPGSIFKVLTVAAGVDSKVIDENSECPACAGPVHIGQYTIKTWNDVYSPNITMTEALTKSDNTAMVWAANLMGQQTFLSYIKKFGIGDPTRLELQEDTSTPIRKDWKEIDLDTSSFGQGIVTTGMQMVKAIGAVANKGLMMRPQIIDHVTDSNTGEVLPVQSQVEGQVITKDSAEEVTRMMVTAANEGESKWTISKTHNTAAKTGTAQVPVDGHYDQNQTIASYIGFAPPENPKFVMLVRLTAPKTSPWAAETAAPLWYHVADKLFLLMNIPPDK